MHYQGTTNKNDSSGTWYTCPMHQAVKQTTPGLCLECGMNLVPMKSKKSQAVLYTCPMHPDVQQDHEGLCPECGMKLVVSADKGKAHSAAKEFGKHHGHKTNVFKTKFWVSLVLSIPVVAYADVVQTLLDYQAPAFPGSQFVPLVLASIIFFYGGWVFIASAYRELRAKMLGMMTLIALAISVAYGYSVAVTFLGGGATLFWELATLVTVMLLGHWLEMRAVSGAQSALKELSKLLPDQAEVVRGGVAKTISLEELKKDDIVLVRPGGKIPADGVIVEGVSDIDESIVTGESKLVSKKVGSEVIAGTINGDGSLQVRVTKIGDDTFLAGVMRLVAQAQSSKSSLQLLSDKAAYYLTVIAVVTGGVTLASWLALADPAFAMSRTVAVLVIACPHALGLAIPLVASISTTKAAQSGFLVKQRLSLEAARGITTVLFDKTGTLTEGTFGVDEIMSAEGADEVSALAYAASVNSQSEHPIARAIVKTAQNKKIKLLPTKNFERLPGKGAQAIIDGSPVLVGSQTLLVDNGLAIPDNIKIRVAELSAQGKTVIFVIDKGRVLGAIALADIIREESRQAIKTLHSLGIKTAMITGDSQDVAAWVAGELGIDQYFARVLPDKKAEIVKKLQTDEFENSKLEFVNSRRRRAVAMIGDGVNDAPALMQADVGIAIGAGTNVAIESAGIILVRNDPRDIAKIIKLSRLTYAKMLQNLFWATGYNVVAIPLAAGVLAFQGILLQPALAALFMSLSTVIVAFNALLLKRRKV